MVSKFQRVRLVWSVLLGCVLVLKGCGTIWSAGQQMQEGVAHSYMCVCVCLSDSTLYRTVQVQPECEAESVTGPKL